MLFSVFFVSITPFNDLLLPLFFPFQKKKKKKNRLLSSKLCSPKLKFQSQEAIKWMAQHWGNTEVDSLKLLQTLLVNRFIYPARYTQVLYYYYSFLFNLSFFLFLFFSPSPFLSPNLPLHPPPFFFFFFFFFFFQPLRSNAINNSIWETHTFFNQSERENLF